MKTKLPFLECLLVILLAGACASAMADESTDVVDPELSPLTRTLSVGIAAGLMRFDSNFKFTDTGSGRSIFIDSEGTFGLPEQKTVPVIYGSWRPSQKHGLGFGYFSVRRDSEFVAIDNTSDFIRVGASFGFRNAAARFSDE